MATTRTKEELQKIFMDYFDAEGYKASIDSDGDVLLKIEGKTYFITLSEKDPMFFNLVYPNFWSIESQEELIRVLVAADDANRISKVAKIYTVKEFKDLTCTAESFLPDIAEAPKVFERSFGCIRNCIENFKKKITELKG